jgi:hypothetical protein
MKNSLLLYLSIIVCLVGCIEPAYFISPLNSTSQTYHTIPLRSDSIKSATYVNGIITLGGANQNGRDNIYSFNGNISQSHNIGHLQAWYGIGVTAGNYLIQKYSETDIVIPPTDNFFCAVGLNGGVNVVVPFGNRGSEWRVIGIETSVQNEFGDYLKLRKSLIDSTTYSLVEANNWTTTLGGYSEVIWKLKEDEQLGYKISCGSSLQNGNNFYGTTVHAEPVYFLNTLHVTRKNVTAFGQISLGTYAASFQFGINYNICKKRK